MSWQKPARIAVAIVGLGSAAGVYYAMGERHVPPPSAPIQSRIPEATVEISGCVLKNFPGTAKNFEVECDLMGFYPDGTKKITGDPLVIRVHKGENRTFKVMGKEAKVSGDENQIEVFGGPVRLEDSDGFWLETDRASVNRINSVSNIAGAATFGKGRMTGSGVGLTYDNEREVLVISQQTRVKTVDERGKVVSELSSETGTLDRLQHLLTLDTGVHVLRDDQVIDTDHATGHLSASNDIVTAMELYGNSRVAGGPSIDAMKARDIILEYTDDGKTLETAKLAGSANIAMKSEGEGSGRRIEGESVDVTLAADGTLTSAVARDNVSLGLPAGADSPPRTIKAQTLDGTGEAGKGLTRVTFKTDVLFEEQPLRGKGPATDKQSTMRTARSQRLETSLADDAVTAAAFSGDVTFEEAGLKACAAVANYLPEKGTLALSGATKAGLPMVADEQVAIEAETIDVTLENRKMSAGVAPSSRSQVTTFMRSTTAAQRCKPSKPRPQTEQGANKVPQLLKADAPVTITSRGLDYDSQKGYATYTGRTTLVQDGEGREGTQISADGMVLDQSKGDLTATGSVKSSLLLDGKSKTGLAYEMRYRDEQRLLTYSSQPKSNGEASLVSPGSTMRAGTIRITLAPSENTLQSMRADRNVFVTEGDHTVTGGNRLDYTALKEIFVITGDGNRLVTAVTREEGRCRKSFGNEISFKKGSTAVSVSGGQSADATTQPMKDGSCTVPTR